MPYYKNEEEAEMCTSGLDVAAAMPAYFIVWMLIGVVSSRAPPAPLLRIKIIF
jgi:hypothetical protein